MQTSSQTFVPKKSFTTRCLNWLGLTNEVTIKVYHGYGHTHNLVLYGHVLQLGPMRRTKYTKSLLHNILALLRLFIVKPYPFITVQLHWKEQLITTQTDSDGFFKFEWEDDSAAKPGWHTVLVTTSIDGNNIAGTGAVYITHATQYGFISDIDDTFLISHSSNLIKRLRLLFTRNARSRKPFEGVVIHYQLMAQSNTTADAPNPFFYVSSSEWNLYDFLLEFTNVNALPQGVFLLNVLKSIGQIFKTGQNNHATKFIRIARILESYSRQQFVLLGDSSQQDPYIYASLANHFPTQVKAVYIRAVHKKNYHKVAAVLQKIEAANVPCCFFQHSSEAIAHSKKIGLITENNTA